MTHENASIIWQRRQRDIQGAVHLLTGALKEFAATLHICQISVLLSCPLPKDYGKTHLRGTAYPQ
jgi:hypothetical protein